MAQNWNNLIGWLKRKLGVPVAFLEYSDDDLRNIIVEDVLPDLSQYIGRPLWIRLGSKDRLANAESDPQIAFQMYQIPVPNDYVIIDVQDVYWHRDNMGVMGIYQNMLTVMDPRDTVMTNEFLDMLNSLEVVQAFHFVAPNRIYFERDLMDNDVILECKAEHNDLSTIPSDVYREYLKPWALAEILENIAAMRSHFKEVSTPFGQLNLNADDLMARALTLRQGIQEKLDATPPDHLVHIF